MRKKNIPYLFFGLIIYANYPINNSSAQSNTVKTNVTDTIFGELVNDPYRWMENLSSDSLRNWLKVQKEMTDKEKAKFKNRFFTAYNDILSKSRYTILGYKRMGPYYFHLAYGENAYKWRTTIYYQEELTGIRSKFHFACEPNSFYNDKTVWLHDYSLADDGKNLAVLISKDDENWGEIRVQNIELNKTLDDKVEWVKLGSVEWWQGGFFYSRYPKPQKIRSYNDTITRQMLYYHQLGHKQEEDKLLLPVADSADGYFSFKMTADNKYLILNNINKINGQWYSTVSYKNLDEGLVSEIHTFIVAPFKDRLKFDVIDLVNDKFIVQSDYQAPNFRILAYNRDSINSYSELVKEFQDVLLSVHHVNHSLVAVYLTNGILKAPVFDYKGTMINFLQFDTGTNASGFYGSPDDSVILYYKNTFYTPPCPEVYDLKHKHAEAEEKTEVYYDFDQYTTRIVTYQSKDGTPIPMYLTYKKTIRLTGNNPVLLVAAGNPEEVIKPYYYYSNILFCANEGVIAVPMIRGGMEKGEIWKKAGIVLNKQNAIDDFIAAAEYLQREGYTSKQRMAVEGTESNAMTVAAAMVQRPELFKVVIGNNGIYDPVSCFRYEGGHILAREYGSVASHEEFENMIKYSPLQNLKPDISYPALYLMVKRNTAAEQPFQSYKFLAAIQENTIQWNPHVLYIEDEGSNGKSLPFDNRCRREASKLSFIFTQFGLPINVN